MTTVSIAGLDPDLVPYLDALALQRRVHADVVAGRRDDALLLLEHPPVYTAGRRTEPGELPDDGAPVVPVDRGGRITWHGPGQLVGYPIVRLGEPVDVVAHVRRIEGALIGALSALGLAGHRVDGRSGVWVSGGDGPPAKVAAIGIRVASGVTMHGFALNCSNDLSPFERIVPCGIPDAGVTTVSAELGHTVTPAGALDAVVDAVLHALDGAMEPAA